MKTRIVALVAVAGFAGVASAQTAVHSLGVTGATQVGPNAYEVDISGGDAGALTITLFGQLVNPGNLNGLVSSRGNLLTGNSGVDVGFSGVAFVAPFTALAGFEPPASANINYQPGFDAGGFPSAGPQPSPAVLGVGAPVAMFRYTIDFSNATDGGTITITDEAIASQANQSFFAFLGVWNAAVNVDVPVTGAGAVTITFVPAPGALALLGLGGLVAGRRRR